jgi:hypothetical protein
MRTLLLLMLVGATGSSALSAKEITGAITGVVTDQSGAVVPGATVTVRNVATNLESSMVTDVSGVYLASNLAVGQYEVKVELAGFRTDIRSGLEVHVADRLRGSRWR